ncbi:MAG TPA: DUF6065 family protein [Rhodopila sp.]|jgi:hypothetical protein|nr:DUF6065 family protein [Rhodopila sp.]
MTTNNEPIVRFHQLFNKGRAPERAERTGCGILPIRAVRYCEALTSATAFGWWVYPPIDVEVMWDGTEIFWRCEQAPDWMPLLPSAQLPDYAAAFDSVAPKRLTGCSPPFLTALPEPGALQLWTGLVAQTAPDWHLLVRAPANMPGAGGISLYEGIVEADRWFGPLFVNMRFTRSHIPVRLRADYPLALVQPVHRQTYANELLDRMEVTGGPALLTAEHWDAYYATIVEPNSRPDRPFGAYATAARKKRHRCAHAAAAATA